MSFPRLVSHQNLLAAAMKLATANDDDAPGGLLVPQDVIFGLAGEIIGQAITVNEALTLAENFSRAELSELGLVLQNSQVIFGDTLTVKIGSLLLIDTTTIIRRRDPWLDPFLEAILTDGKTIIVENKKLKGLPAALFRGGGSGEFSEVRLFIADDNEIRCLPSSLFTGCLKNLEYLSVSSNRLEQLPNELLNPHKSLIRLNLSRNMLASLPDWISEISGLRELYVGQNRLRSFPTIRKGFASLQTLDLSFNQLRKLRSKICLPTLCVLLIAHNPLREISEELTRYVVGLNASHTMVTALVKLHSAVDLVMSRSSLGCIRKITSSACLIRMIIDGNNLMELPSGIFGGLKALEELNVANNRLIRVPEDIGHLSSLRILIASNNRLSVLPTSICFLSALRTLELDCNALSSLPAQLGSLSQLQTLNVEQNKLRNLPKSLPRAESLRSLWVKNNPLDHLPASLTKKHTLMVHQG